MDSVPVRNIMLLLGYLNSKVRRNRGRLYPKLGKLCVEKENSNGYFVPIP